MSKTKKVPTRKIQTPGRKVITQGNKAKDFKGTLKKLFQYLKPHTFSVIIVLFFAIGSTIFSIIGPKMLGNITNQVVKDVVKIKFYEEIVNATGMPLPEGTKGEEILSMLPKELLNKIPESYIQDLKEMDLSKKPQVNFDAIKRLALILLGIYVLSALFGVIQGFIMSGVAQKISFRLREEISLKIDRLPLKYFDSKTHGDVLSRVTNDVDTVNNTLNQSLIQIITSLTTLIGIIIMMLTISITLTLISLLLLPLSFLIIINIIKKSQKYFSGQQKTLGSLNGHIEEMYSGHSVLKVFGGEERSINTFKKINNELYSYAWKSQFLSGLMMPIMMFIGNIGFVAVCVVGGWLAIKGRLFVGDIQAFIQYVRQLNQPINQSANIANVLQSTAAAAERVFEFLSEEEEIKDIANPVHLTDVKGEVVMQNVVFGYDENIIIKSLNLYVKPGQRVAIVGPTGAGKTTIVNLLMRFYDINSGSILIDGVNIKDITRSELRKLFGMVLQDTWLFSGSIKENIRYSKHEASDEEVINAAKAAHVHHFIKTLPEGYNMRISEEGDNISQGQKQLITIARAMLADPPILILDEATSSVDTRTEILIQKAMDNLMKGRTSFIIAHRLSTIRDADIILVMKDGNIVEQGTHKELLDKKGFYYELYNSQFATA